MNERDLDLKKMKNSQNFRLLLEYIFLEQKLSGCLVGVIGSIILVDLEIHFGFRNFDKSIDFKIKQINFRIKYTDFKIKISGLL